MSRKNKVFRKRTQPDAKYKSMAVSKFINKVMLDGKKSTAQKIVYGALVELSKKVNEVEAMAFEKAVRNVIPLMEVRSRRVGGSTYQVPVEVRPERGLSLAMRWIVKNASTRSGRSMEDRLSAELVDAFNKMGGSVKKREDTHKMAEANKAFAHFRW
jgi:small subunit ribosomal protein S7